MAEETSDLMKVVKGCHRGPVDHLPCYFSGGTGIYHMCQFGYRPEKRNLDLCCRRYQKALEEPWDQENDPTRLQFVSRLPEK